MVDGIAPTVIRVIPLNWPVTIGEQDAMPLLPLISKENSTKVDEPAPSVLTHQDT
ncbi:hypothetical protein [Lacrimispora sp.]|uniref:hypothetical protein n=1 Tax=Lacrimispora sp. TaxID=2719234 RepID=UPI0028A9DF46|nr:hypothetical protein [Lacrimispora sp.]